MCNLIQNEVDLFSQVRPGSYPYVLFTHNTLINMKLHLPLVLLGLVTTVAYAGGTYTAQVINIVQEGKVGDPYYLLLFSTANNGPLSGTSNENPMAVVKDGLGEWKLTKDITVNDPLVVREGTFTIEGATVKNNTTLSNGVSNLSVGGKSAHLVLDNATYKQDLDYAQNYVSAIAIGTTDGKGAVTLKNNSVLHTDQYIFAGYKSISNGYVTGTTVSQNDSTPYSGGEQGRSAINIESGSVLSAGTCFQFADVDVTIDGEGSKMVDLNRDSSPASAAYSYFGTADNSVTNIRVKNGAALELKQNVMTGYGAGSGTNIEVSGEGSTMSVAGDAFLGIGSYDYDAKSYKENSSTTSVAITDGATLKLGSYVDVGYTSKSNLTVDASSKVVAMDGAEHAEIYVEKNGSVNAPGSVNVDVTVDGGTYMGVDTRTADEFGSNAGFVYGESKFASYTDNEFSVLNNGRVSDVQFDNCTINLEDVAILHNVVLGGESLYSMLAGVDDVAGSVTLNIQEGTEINYSGVLVLGGDLNFCVVLDANGYTAGDDLFTITSNGGMLTLDENAEVSVTLVDTDGNVLNTGVLNFNEVSTGNYRLSSNVDVVPEPTTATLSLLALAALAARRRRK